MKSLIKFITNTIIILVVIIGIIVFYNWYMRKEGKVAYFMGYATYAVKGDSMRPVIESGDLLIIHKENSYQEGDIITFVTKDNEIVTHRIAGIDEDGSYITKGDNNVFEDPEHIKPDKVYGKMTYDFTQYNEVFNFIVKYKWFLLGGLLVLSIVGRLLL